MILEIFSIKTLERVDMIKTFSFVQYVKEFCGSGSFSVKVPINEDSVQFLRKGYLILFENDVMGIIQYRKKESNEGHETVEIKGYLLNRILNWRSFLVTQSFRGSVTDITRRIVDLLFISSSDSRRNIESLELSTDTEYFPESPSISTQFTGKTAQYAVESLLSNIGYGYSIVPIIKDYDESLQQLTNISRMEYRVHKPTDRTIGNSYGNTPVVFSSEMNNLSSSTYIEDDTEFCSVAIVAGEGEGTERVTVEVGDTSASGFDRIELYVDARDLQSTSEEVTMTEEEYIQALTSRGYTYLEDKGNFLSVDGNVIDGASSYVYGKDFFVGDYVSIIDDSFGIVASVQISSVTKSLTETGEKLDITFGKERVSIQKIVRKRGIV